MAGFNSRQHDLFVATTAPASEKDAVSRQCHVVAVGKRRSGGIRYWCLRHGADATAKYGTPALTCRAAHIRPVDPDDILELDLNRYENVALWGAVPPIYDTTRKERDNGIHVHARLFANGAKEIDRTFRAVTVFCGDLPRQGTLVSELDAVYFMVTSIFGYAMKYVTCSHCGSAHLDKDWFSVHPHRRHLCAACGRHFWDTERAVGNPICGLRDYCAATCNQQTRSTREEIRLQQRDYGGGIQVWGSNPAFVWTGERPEEQGIHVHAFREGEEKPEVDETYPRVTIDDVNLDPVMVRVLMAQKTLPYLRGRIASVTCHDCGKAQFSRDEAAYTPIAIHRCSRCGEELSAPGRLRKTVANPLMAILEELAHGAPRSVQTHETELLSETL